MKEETVTNYSISLSMRQTLLALSLSLFAGFAHAMAYYDAHADAILSIDDVINLTNPGDLSVFAIGGNVFVENEGFSEHGDAQASLLGVTDLQSSTASDPGLLSQSSDVHGNAYPLLNTTSIAESHHSSLGEFNFYNLSSTDSLQIEFSMPYHIAVNAGLTNYSNENAYSEAFVRLADSLLQVNLDKTLSADAKRILAPDQDAWGDTLLFYITLQPEQSDRLTLNVSATGNSDPNFVSTPEPATLYLLAVGLFGLADWGRRRKPSSV
jgi:hypothetical protein